MASSSSTLMCVGVIPSQGEEKPVMVTSSSTSVCGFHTLPGRRNLSWRVLPLPQCVWVPYPPREKKNLSWWVLPLFQCVGSTPSQGEAIFHGKMSHVIFRDIKISGTNHGALMVVDSEPKPQEVLMRYKGTILNWAKYWCQPTRRTSKSPIQMRSLLGMDPRRVVPARQRIVSRVRLQDPVQLRRHDGRQLKLPHLRPGVHPPRHPWTNTG